MGRSHILCESRSNRFLNWLTRCSLDTQDNCGDGGVPTFQQYNPAAYKTFKTAYLTYIKHVASIENGTEPVQKTTNFSMADLTYSKKGLPLVPAPMKNINGVETNLTQQQIIRAYLTKHYSM